MWSKLFNSAIAFVFVILISISVFAQAAENFQSEEIPLGFTLDFSESNPQTISLPLPKGSNFSSFKFVINAGEVDYVDYKISSNIDVPPHSPNYQTCNDYYWLSTQQKIDRGDGLCLFSDQNVNIDIDLSKVKSAVLSTWGSKVNYNLRSSATAYYFVNKQCITTEEKECTSSGYRFIQTGNVCYSDGDCDWRNGYYCALIRDIPRTYNCGKYGWECNGYKTYSSYQCTYQDMGSLSFDAIWSYDSWDYREANIPVSKLKQGANLFSFARPLEVQTIVMLKDINLRLFTSGIYPKDFKVDVGDDGSYDYTLLGEIKGNKTIEIPSEKVNALLQNCEADADGLCEIPVSFYLGGAARVELISLLIEEPVKIELEENQTAAISPFALAAGGSQENSAGSEEENNSSAQNILLPLALLSGAGALGYSYLSRRNLDAQNKNNYLKISAAIAKNKIERENKAIESAATAAKSAASAVSNAVESVSNSIKSFASGGFSFSRKSGSFSSSSKSSSITSVMKSAANSVGNAASIFKQSTGNGATRKNIDNYLLDHKTGARYASGLLKAGGATAGALGMYSAGMGAVPAGLALAAGGGAAYVAGGAIEMGLNRAVKTDYSAPKENIFRQAFGIKDDNPVLKFLQPRSSKVFNKTKEEKIGDALVLGGVSASTFGALQLALPTAPLAIPFLAAGAGMNIGSVLAYRAAARKEAEGNGTKLSSDKNIFSSSYVVRNPNPLPMGETLSYPSDFGEAQKFALKNGATPGMIGLKQEEGGGKAGVAIAKWMREGKNKNVSATNASEQKYFTSSAGSAVGPHQRIKSENIFAQTLGGKNSNLMGSESSSQPNIIGLTLGRTEPMPKMNSADIVDWVAVSLSPFPIIGDIADAVSTGYGAFYYKYVKPDKKMLNLYLATAPLIAIPNIGVPASGAVVRKGIKIGGKILRNSDTIAKAGSFSGKAQKFLKKYFHSHPITNDGGSVFSKINLPHIHTGLNIMKPVGYAIRDFGNKLLGKGVKSQSEIAVGLSKVLTKIGLRDVASRLVKDTGIFISHGLNAISLAVVGGVASIGISKKIYDEDKKSSPAISDIYLKEKNQTVKTSVIKPLSIIASKIQTKFVELNSFEKKVKEAGSGFVDNVKNFVSGKSPSSAPTTYYKKDKSDISNPIVSRDSSTSSGSKSSGSSSGSSGGFANTVKSAATNAVNTVKSAASSAVSAVKSVVSNAASAAKDFLFGKK